MTINEQIKKARIEKGLTQDELATAAKVSRVQIGKIERGEKLKSLTNLESIADALQLDLVLTLTKRK